MEHHSSTPTLAAGQTITSDPPIRTWQQLLDDADQAHEQYVASLRQGRQTIKEMIALVKSIKSDYVRIAELTGVV